MIKEEQEKLGREIVERLNKGESVRGISISNFYNIKQFYYIKIEKISLDSFDLIVLPEDNDGDSLLEIRFRVYKSSYNNEIILNYVIIKCYINNNNIHYCFTKFNLTGEIINNYSLDYWLIKEERFRWIIEKLKKDNPEYNLAMYELFGFNEEYVRRELGYFKDTRNYIKEYRYEKDY